MKPSAAWKKAEENQGLVVKVLKEQFGWIQDRAKTGAMDWEDYYSAGVYGLYRAALKFDPARGCTFSTYAFHWIRQAISRAYRTRGFRFVKVPCWAFDRLSKLQRTYKENFERWLKDYGPREIVAAQAALSDGIYLDGEFKTETGNSHAYIESVLSTPDGQAISTIQHEDRMRVLLLALRRLPTRDREALLWHFGFKREGNDPNNQMIARAMKIKKESVKRMTRRALRRLREILKEQAITSEDL